MFYLKKLKSKQIKSKASRNKERIKAREEIKETENRKKQTKSMQVKGYFLKSSIKLIKLQLQ